MNNFLRIEKKKEKMLSQLISDFCANAMHLILIEAMMILALAGALKSFSHEKIGMGVLLIVLWAILLTIFVKNWYKAIDMIDGEVMKFWNYYKVLRDAEDFEFVDEQHIPRID